MEQRVVHRVLKRDSQSVPWQQVHTSLNHAPIIIIDGELYALDEDLDLRIVLFCKVVRSTSHLSFSLILGFGRVLLSYHLLEGFSISQHLLVHVLWHAARLMMQQ